MLIIYTARYINTEFSAIKNQHTKEKYNNIYAQRARASHSVFI